MTQANLVGASLDTDAQGILNALTALAENPPEPATLEVWLSQWNRLRFTVQTLWMTSMLACQRQVDDQVANATYQYLMRHWMPQINQKNGALAEIALEVGRDALKPELCLRLENERLEHDPELSQLRSQEELLGSQYAQITGQQKLQEADQTLVLSEAISQLGSIQNRAERETRWRQIKAVEQADWAALDQLMSELLETRQRIAVHAGEAHFAEFAWREDSRDYSPAEALSFLNEMHQLLGDLYDELDRGRARQLGITELRPWDSAVPLLAPSWPLPAAAFPELAQELIQQIDPEFAAVLKTDLVHYDLEPRQGKARRHFAALAMATRQSYLHCNYTGGFNQFRGFLHEIGHVIHHQTLIAETATTNWDFIGFKEVEEFFAFFFSYQGTFQLLARREFSEDERRSLRRSMAEEILNRFKMVDERLRLELWLYQQQGSVTASELDTQALELSGVGGINWQGLEEIRAKVWQNTHFFTTSFYNIDYAVAMTAAVLMLLEYRTDPTQSLHRLKTAMRLGGTAGLRVVLHTLGISFPFSREQLMLVRQELVNWL